VPSRRKIEVDSVMALAQKDEANAAYLWQASSEALLSGNLSAIADILKGASGAMTGLGGFGGGGGGASPIGWSPAIAG
jgi:hypothetical protein